MLVTFITEKVKNSMFVSIKIN